MIRLQFPRTFVVAIALLVGGCGDETSPASPDLPPADASVEISVQTLGFGTADPLAPRTIVVRILGEDGVVKREIVGVFSEDPNRVLGPYQVPVESQEGFSAQVEVEIVGIMGEARVVLWSARSSEITLLPGERVDLGLTLLRGGLELRGLTGLTITGVPSEIGIGETFQAGLSASPDTPGLVPAWGALDPEILAVDPHGQLRGVALGMGRVVAAAGPVSDTVSVVVRSLVEHIEISPDTHTLESLGETMGLTATVLGFRGDTLPDHVVEWSASPAGVVSVSPAGLALASAVGTAEITASAEGVSASISVEVTQVPASLVVSPSTLSLVSGEGASFSERVLDALGSRIPGVPVTWASSDSSVVSVDSEGNVLAVGPGSADVLAQAGLLQGSARVVVEVGEPASIIVTPAGGSIEPGETLLLSAQVLDGAGNEVPGAVVSWSSRDPALATVAGSGQVRGESPGTVVILAASGPATDSVEVVVTDPTAASIEISPDTHTFESLGETIGLTATVLGFRGDTLPDHVVEWSASPAGVVSVSPAGLALASAVGIAAITASSEGVSTSISVEVTQVPASLVVSPSTLSLVSGEGAKFSERVLDALGSRIPGVPVTWASSDSSVVSVDSAGNVLAVGLGSADVLAQAGLLQGSARVVVEAEPASIIVTPAGGSIEPGETLLLSAQVLDGAGNEVPGAVVSWSSRDPALATVAGSGQVRGESPGTVVILAASGPATDSVEVVVTDPTAASIEIVSGNGQTAPAGLQLPDSLHVRVLSLFGVPVPGVSVAWAPQGGGSAIPSPSVTDASGVARTEWVLGLGMGAQELGGSIPGAMVTFEATASGASRVFDRVRATDAITVSSDPSGDFNFPDGDWTLAMWVRPADLSEDYQYAFSGATSPFAQGVNVYLNPVLGMHWTTSVQGATSGGIMGGVGGGAPAVAGEWQHLVVRRSGTTVRLWSNGSVIPIGSIEISEAANASGTPRLGAQGDLSGGWYSGGLAHVARWSSALSPEELADLAAGVHALDVSPGTRDWFIPLGRDPESQVGGDFILSVFGTPAGDAPPVAPPSTP